MSRPILLAITILFFLPFVSLLLRRPRHSSLDAAPHAHWSCKYTSFWIRLQRLLERDTASVHAAHVHLGPVVRLAPNEISVCDFDFGVKPIYEGRLPKTDWYQIAASYGTEPMFVMKDEVRHTRQKKTVAKTYLKTTILKDQAWVTKLRELASDLRSAVGGLCGRDSDVEVYDLFFAWVVATVTTYVFGPGGSVNELGDLAGARELREIYDGERYRPLWTSLFPQKILDLLGFSAEVDCIRNMRLRAEEACKLSTKQQDTWTNVYSYMKSSVFGSDLLIRTEDEELKQLDALISSEMQDHVVAGIDTSLATLTVCAWLLSLPQNRKWQDALRQEVRSFHNQVNAPDIERLPILEAVIKETLRLYPPAAGCQPRMVERAMTLGPEGSSLTVNPNAVVHAQAWTLHRNPTIFDDPEQWHPERWLECSPERKRQMDAWFWAFGSGTRRCIGENLAMSSLKVALVTIWSNFETEATENTEIHLSQGNLALPMADAKGDFLRLHIRPSK